MRSISPDEDSDRPINAEFLISFLVDARGGSMMGSRRSGVRMVIPPQSAGQPVRITCRQLRPDQVLHLPPLSEGESLACRVLHLTPASFLAPVLLEFPQFASLPADREIAILRSDTGKEWITHKNPVDNKNITRFLAGTDNSRNTLYANTNRPPISVILTQFPEYLAIISRPYQASANIGPQGGMLRSHLAPGVQCLVPPKAITRQTSIGLSVLPIKEGLVQGGAVSSIITIEQRRKRFHRPITVTIPIPESNESNSNLPPVTVSFLPSSSNRF